MAKWTPSPNFLPGNTEMGSDLEDSHQLTGSVTISGSLTLNGTPVGGGGGGTITDGDNVGSGDGEVFKQASGTDLQFRTLVGSGVTINQTTNTIELTASGGGGGSPGGVESSVQVNDGAGGFEGNSNLKYIPGGGGPDALRLTGSIELSGTINQTGSINLFSDVVGGPPFPDISFAPTYEDAGAPSGYVGSRVTIGSVMDGGPAGTEASVINYGSLSCSHGITASSFVGDGSGLTNLPGGGGSPVGPADSVQFKSGSAFSGSSGLLVRYPGGSQPEWADLVVSGSVFCQRLYGVEDGQGVLTRYQDGLGPSIDVQEELITLGTEYGSEDGSLRLGYSIEHYANEPTASHYQGAFSARTFYSAIDALGSAENGSVTISAQNSNVHRTVYDGAMQLTMSAMTPGASYVLFLSNSVGAAAVTYDPATFKFPGGTVPTNTQVQGAYDIISGISDGVQFFCDMTKNFS